jgi:hypothetical protein
VKHEFYRHPYRHFDWDPQAQHSPSIDIYRGQSALPRWPAFGIYRDPSFVCMRSPGCERTNCSCRLNQEDTGIRSLTGCRIHTLWQSFCRRYAAARKIRASSCTETCSTASFHGLIFGSVLARLALGGDLRIVVRLQTQIPAVRVSSLVTRGSHGNIAVVSVAKQRSSPALSQSGRKGDRTPVRSAC